MTAGLVTNEDLQLYSFYRQEGSKAHARKVTERNQIRVAVKVKKYNDGCKCVQKLDFMEELN